MAEAVDGLADDAVAVGVVVVAPLDFAASAAAASSCCFKTFANVGLPPQLEGTAADLSPSSPLAEFSPCEPARLLLLFFPSPSFAPPSFLAPSCDFEPFFSFCFFSDFVLPEVDSVVEVATLSDVG